MDGGANPPSCHAEVPKGSLRYSRQAPFRHCRISCGSCRRTAGVPKLVEDRRSRPGRRDDLANARKTWLSTASRSLPDLSHSKADAALSLLTEKQSETSE